MDTPDRSRAAAAQLSNFEDSPVFNFINSLSPIQPVKSVHSAQMFQSLTFASISSIFTSPHVNPQKESRFLIRNHISDFGRPESSTENDQGENLHEGVPNAVKSSSCAVVTSGDCSMSCLLNEEAVDLPDDSSSLSRNLLQPVQFDSGSPNHNTGPRYSRRPDLKLSIRGKSVQPVQFVQDGVDKRKNLFTNENNLQENSCHENNNEDMPGCDWESLISVETDDMLLLEPSTESEACGGSDGISNDQKAACFASCPLKLPEDIDGSQKIQHDIFSSSCIQNMEDVHENRYREITEQYETDHTPQILSSNCHNQAARDDKNQVLENGIGDCVPVGCKVDSQQQRGTRRRCLVFDVAAGSKKNLHKDSNLNPSISLPPKTNFSTDDAQLVSLKHGTSPSPRMLPGIGLHLNALATTSKERVVTQNTLPSGRRLISMPCSIGPFHPPSSGQKTMKTSLVVENSLGSTNTELHDLQMELYDDAQVPASKNGQDSSQSSPKKKKRKSENGGEGEGCKRCNCKKSKCLKLYCECFAAGVYCVEPCSCHGCFNKPIHEETVLATRKQIESRNPLAFAPKVIRVSEPVQETGEEAHKTPASARHKRGCNCKKSSCLKKYCECFQGGVGCSISCRCEGCKNAFGRKDGLGEFENEGDELVARENEIEKPDDGSQKVDVQTTEQEDSTENTLPATPLQICRSLVEQQCFSRGKPPRSSTFPFGRSPTLNLPQSFRKCQIPLPPHKADKHVKTVSEDDTPEILRSNASPGSGVKIASPNRKRVSPPHNGIGLSPTHKGSRKLILKSIPSFPSLSADVPNEYPINCSVSLFDSSAPG